MVRRTRKFEGSRATSFCAWPQTCKNGDVLQPNMSFEEKVCCYDIIYAMVPTKLGEWPGLARVGKSVGPVDFRTDVVSFSGRMSLSPGVDRHLCML